MKNKKIYFLIAMLVIFFSITIYATDDFWIKKTTGDLTYYIGRDNENISISNIINSNDITWTKYEDAFRSTLLGIDNSEGIFEEGSRFWVRIINKDSTDSDYDDIYDELDKPNIDIEGTSNARIEFGVMDPEENDITNLNQTVNVLIQYSYTEDIKDIQTALSNSGLYDYEYNLRTVEIEGKMFIILPLNKLSKFNNDELEYKKGDINKDGLVDSADAAIALNLYKYNNATSEDIKIGDMDDNGMIDSADAAMILNVFKYNL